jgi:hypothetical protein
MIIETPVPIALEDLKRYFSDKENTSYLIKYKDCKLKGFKLLTYLSNLAVPIDIDEVTPELLQAYLYSESLVSCNNLELHAIKAILDYKNGEKYTFLKDNEDILQIWVDKLNSLALYNMYIVQDKTLQNFVESHKEDNTKDLKGINFVEILKHEEFFEFYTSVEDKDLIYYKHYFNDYMFKGRSLFDFWANTHNPLFLLTWGIATKNA